MSANDTFSMMKKVFGEYSVSVASIFPLPQIVQKEPRTNHIDT